MIDIEKKEKYQIFCDSTYTPIFSQSWWLDITCNGNWDVYLFESGGEVIAAMPYYIHDTHGLKKITKPLLTQNNGIIIKYPKDQKYFKKLHYEEKIINKVCDFIEDLPIDRYEQQYHYSFTNWLPFYWRKYQEITRYTYVIENTQDMNCVWNDFSPNLRNMIRKSEKNNLMIREDLEISAMYEVNKMTFDRQNIEIPYSLKFLIKLDEACKSNNCCKNYYAIDDENRIHAIIYLIWDQQSMYLLLGGSNPELRKSQAYDALIYRGIKLASDLGLKFDFEGSVIKQIEHSFREFGAVQKPYFRIYKDFKKQED